MDIQKDKQFKVLLHLLVENLAFSQSLIEFLLVQQKQHQSASEIDASIARVHAVAAQRAKKIRDLLFSEFGDIEDLFRP